MTSLEKRDIKRIIRVARKAEPADFVIKNGRIVNVFSHEIYKADVALVDGWIAGIGEDYSGKEEYDAKGDYICPGLMDGHIHIESSMVPIPRFTHAVIPHGTTTVIIDPHEIANVMGTTGISYMLKTSKYNPLNVYVMLPSCVPATSKETAGAELKALDLFPMLQDKWVLGLGEVMNYPGILNEQDDVIDKLKISSGRVIDGHAPGLTGADLNAYVAAGMQSDHECTTLEEAREKLRLGLYIMIREGSTTKNLKDLIPLVTPDTIDRCFFVTDDRNPAELQDSGHMDHLIRLAIHEGLDPISAVKMATLNTARYFGLKHLGAVAPGYQADLIIVKDFDNFTVRTVFKNGVLVAENGQAVFKPRDHNQILMRGSVNVKWIERDQFKVKAVSDRCRVIELIPGQIVTRNTIVENIRSKDGYLMSDPSRDLVKLVVVERHYASGRTGIGLIKGLGLKTGAIASTIAHDSHNIICAGVDDEDIYQAVVQLVRQQGGLSIAKDGHIVATLPLPIGGLMTDRPLPDVRKDLDALVKCAHEQGVTLPHPFMTLSFMALPVIPELKLTDQGLFDVNAFSFTDLFV